MPHSRNVGTRPLAVDDAPEEVRRPPERWWRQRSIVVTEVVAVALAALGFGATQLNWTDYATGLAAGAAFGLAATIGIGGLFPIQAQWELSHRLYGLWEIASTRERRQRLFEELHSRNGFFLGYQLASASSSSVQDLGGIHFIRGFCGELGLTLSVEEWERLSKAPTNREELDEIVNMIRSRVEQYAPPQWWCFFLLGSTVVWLTDDLEARRSVTRVRTQLEQIRANPALELDQNYFTAVEHLLSVLPQSSPIGATDWQTLVAGVNEILGALPQAEPSLRVAPFAVPLSDWFWFENDGLHGAARQIGERTLAALPGGRFELSGGDDDDCVVRIENSQWTCDIHAGADGRNPCRDIELVSDMTDGGSPVTEARLILVRSGE
jgi:hypothetical protein